MSSFLPPGLFRLAYEVDAYVGAAARTVRRRLGLGRPLRILPYRGYGTAEAALVKARVLEDNRVPPPRAKRSLLGSAFASYKRFATVEMPHVPLRAHWDGHTYEGRTDEEGFVDLWVTPPPGAQPGWHEVHLELLDEVPGPPATATARVLLVGDTAEYGIISDLDDTVIVTNVANLFKRAWALFLSEASPRVPFEGVSAFYSALRDGSTDGARNPIFYVSSSPWNLYEHLEHFLEVHHIPFGPILLRDWGLTRTGFAPGGGHGHKLDKIREVLEGIPELKFLLIGDSGQHDPEHYTTIAAEHPGRILAIYIRDVTASPRREAELRELAARASDSGTELVLVHDTVTAARHAARHHFIRWPELHEVRHQRREDMGSAEN
ncbi:MAG: App1 family protein [Myxococcota bacterium]